MDSINGERHTIAATFGYGHSDWAMREFFLDHLAQAVCESFGGFRYTTGTGFWTADGNSEPPFTGQLFEEDTVTLHVTVTGDVESAVQILQAAAVEAREKTTGEVPLAWVNVETWETKAFHFDMSETKEEETCSNYKEASEECADALDRLRDRGVRQTGRGNM